MIPNRRLPIPLALLSAMGTNHVFGRSITDDNRRHGTEPDPTRLRAAEIKRARKNAKRVGAVSLPAADGVEVVDVPK